VSHGSRRATHSALSMSSPCNWTRMLMSPSTFASVSRAGRGREITQWGNVGWMRTSSSNDIGSLHRSQCAPLLLQPDLLSPLCLLLLLLTLLLLLPYRVRKRKNKVRMTEVRSVSCEAGKGFKVLIDSYNHLPSYPVTGTLQQSGLTEIHALMCTT
jgi:hypothetical protein